MKILIIRFSSIGDLVLISSAVRCIKEQTNSNVHLITKKQWTSVFDNSPYIKKVFSFDDNMMDVIKLLKKEKYDIVIDLHNSIRSFFLKMHLLRPSLTINKGTLQKLLLVNFHVGIKKPKHIVDRGFSVLKKININNDGRGLDFFLSDDTDISTVASIPDRYIVFAIGTKHNTKTIPNEVITTIVNKVSKYFPVILVGGKDDINKSKNITCDNLINLTGELTIQQSALLIKQSVAVICGDTGMMHIAAAFKKNLISLWAGTTPQLGMYPYFPSNFQGLNLMMEVAGLSCRPCSKIGKRYCRKKDFRCTRYSDAQISKIEETISKYV